MSALAVQRFSASFQGSHLATERGQAAGTEQPGIAQLKALQHVDVTLAPEHLDFEGRMRANPFGDTGRRPDDLRLPPPPQPTLDGPAMMQATRRTLTQFQSQATKPVSVDADALRAEGRMMAVLGGIDRLKLEIQARAEQGVLA
jgi:hypothetical protein